MKNNDFSQHYKVHTCLPFVELAQQSDIQMGPIIFWPASRYKEFIDKDSQKDFESYLSSIAKIKAKINEKSGFITTMTLPPESTTFISIAKDCNDQELLLLNSIYLLYFACTFHHIYYNHEVPSFGAFRKFIPASFDFINNKTNWQDLHIEEMNREETVCLHLSDKDISNGFGKMLASIYQDNGVIPPERIKDYNRLIQAIRFLVDRFFQRFVNLFEKGLQYPDIIFEPEDVIFLTSSFEALFDINDRQATSDFKHKLRPFLHLKYSKPVELFWKWVDDFYQVKYKIVHGGEIPDPFFRFNPNFEISHILLGIKLFIYSVYYMMFKYHLLESKQIDEYTLPDFKWIHPDEILQFFWTETELLDNLQISLTPLIKGGIEYEELFSDIHLLANLFVSMQEKYYEKKEESKIKFFPSPSEQLNKKAEMILELLELGRKDQKTRDYLNKLLPETFSQHLARSCKPNFS